MKKHKHKKSECEMLADLSDDVKALRKTRDGLASALKRRNIILIVNENDLSSKASDILQAFYEVSSSAKIFQKNIEGLCHDDADVVNARKSIRECIEYADVLSTALNRAEEAFKNNLTYVGYARKVLSRMVTSVASAFSSLTRAIYNRKVKVVFAMLAASALIPATPAIAANAATLLGIGGTSGAAASIPTLLSGFISGLVGPLCHSIRNPVFVMGTSLILGAVMFLKHFPEVDHYIHHSVWTDDSDDDKEDMRRLAARLGWSHDTMEKVAGAVSDAKYAMNQEENRANAVQRAAHFTTVLLAGSASTLVLLGIMSFAILPMGIISLLTGIGCFVTSSTTSAVSGLGKNLFDRPATTLVSSIIGAGAGGAAAVGAVTTAFSGVGLSSLGLASALFTGPGGIAIVASTIAGGFGTQHYTVSAMNAYFDPRSNAVRLVASAVESVASLAQTIIPIVTSPAFLLVCGSFGSLVMAKYAIDTEKAEEDAFVAKKIDEMFSFVTSSDILDTPQSFVDLLDELSKNQSSLADDLNRIREEKYRAISKCVIQGANKN